MSGGAICVRRNRDIWIIRICFVTSPADEGCFRVLYRWVEYDWGFAILLVCWFFSFAAHISTLARFRWAEIEGVAFF